MRWIHLSSVIQLCFFSLKIRLCLCVCTVLVLYWIIHWATCIVKNIIFDCIMQSVFVNWCTSIDWLWMYQNQCKQCTKPMHTQKNRFQSNESNKSDIYAKWTIFLIVIELAWCENYWECHGRHWAGSQQFLNRKYV